LNFLEVLGNAHITPSIQKQVGMSPPVGLLLLSLELLSFPSFWMPIEGDFLSPTLSETAFYIT